MLELSVVESKLVTLLQFNCQIFDLTLELDRTNKRDVTLKYPVPKLSLFRYLIRFIGEKKYSRNYLFLLSENYTVIQGLLDEIVASERAISGWNYKGGIVYDYLTIMNEINAIMAEQSIEVAFVMEKLQPTMSSVCHKIKFFPTNSIKER